MLDIIQIHFKLRKPCSNCPFLKAGAIDLAPDRLASIIRTLIEDDLSTFHCHKTVHSARTGGDWNDDGRYIASGQESMCVGAMTYLVKAGRPTVAMRIAQLVGEHDPQELERHFTSIIDPKT